MAKNKDTGKPRVGIKVKLLNLSDEDSFCASTGVKLPKRGMVVRHDGKLYRDFSAAELAQ